VPSLCTTIGAVPSKSTALVSTPMVAAADGEVFDGSMSHPLIPLKGVDPALKREVAIDGHVYHLGARTAAMLERIARRAEKIERIRIGEIHVKFHNDRVRSLLITESDDPSP
jgi:hypothetical protein